MDASWPAIPCGLVAKSFFNDTYTLRLGDKVINITDKNIAWSSDVAYKYKNIKNTTIPKTLKLHDKSTPTKWTQVQWHDMTDEHFIVWMRTAGLPSFRKLWGKIDQDLAPGRYKVSIDNQYRVQPFQGQKRFVLSTTNALGGKNYFLAVCYLIVGTLCMLFAFIFCIAYMRKRNTNN